MLFQEAIRMVKDLNREAMAEAQKRLDSLTKPLGSLGRLEDMVKQLAGITGKIYPSIDRKTILILCADNGVVDEGVTQAPREITSVVTRNFFRGFTAVNVLARHAGAEIRVVDMGIAGDLDCPGLVNKKIRKGTWNIAKGPAMTREEALKAIEAGIGIVGDLVREGTQLIGTGEMGIGNTTTSSAIAVSLTGSSVEEMVGRGAGLSNKGLEIKRQVVQKAIEINRPDPGDPVDVLAKLGGFDIAGLAGCYIGAAVYRVPILMDGFISAVAALVAVRIAPGVRNYILPSHGSAEPGTVSVLNALNLVPYLNLEMRVGEGTGAVLAFHLVDAAIAAYTQMGTFGDAEIEQYTPQV